MMETTRDDITPIFVIDRPTDLQSGSTFLHYASFKGYVELCKILLRAKAAVDANDEVRKAMQGYVFAN